MDIIVNGQHYASWDEVPADVRNTMSAALPDANRDGVPDLLQGGGLAGLPTGHVPTMSVTNIQVGGKSYSPDELPPAIRDSLRMAGILPAAGAPPGGTPVGPAPGPQWGAQPDAQWGAQPGAQPPAGQVPIPPAQVSAPVPHQPTPIRSGQVMLDGVPVDTAQGAPGIIPRKKHWWQRG